MAACSYAAVIAYPEPSVKYISAEILAKKLLYRADDFTARDLFDLAFLIEKGEAEKLMSDRQTYLPKLQVIVRRVHLIAGAMRPAFDAVEALDYRLLPSSPASMWLPDLSAVSRVLDRAPRNGT